MHIQETSSRTSRSPQAANMNWHHSLGVTRDIVTILHYMPVESATPSRKIRSEWKLLAPKLPMKGDLDEKEENEYAAILQTLENHRFEDLKWETNAEDGPSGRCPKGNEKHEVDGAGPSDQRCQHNHREKVCGTSLPLGLVARKRVEETQRHWMLG